MNYRFKVELIHTINLILNLLFQTFQVFANY